LGHWNGVIFDKTCSCRVAGRSTAFRLSQPGTRRAGSDPGQIALGRLGEPEDIAASVAILVGPDGGWSTGFGRQAAETLARTGHRSTPRCGPWPGAARRVAEYIEANLAEDLTLAELATLAGLSPNHFCTAFGESFGQPPAAWLQARRIARAQAMMLDQPDLGLSAIAQAVGYASQSAFGSAFRKLVGTSPGRWRQVMRA
jgi:AraC family transcriptional regulator